MEQIKKVSLNDTEYQIIDETALHEDHNTDTTAHADIRAQINQLSSEIVDITPVKGVDYYTEEEKVEFETYIADELAKKTQLKPEMAESEEWLEEHGDPSKFYVLFDKTSENYGHIYDCKLTEVTVAGGADYTSVLPSAEMGSDQATGWVEDEGYTANARLSSSGSVVENYTVIAGMGASGYIKCQIGDTIRIKNYYAPQGIASYVIPYDIEKTGIPSGVEGKIIYNTFAPRNSDTLVWDDGSFYTVEGEKTLNGITTFEITETVFGASVEYIRFSGIITENTIVTINDEIKNKITTETKYVWSSTGHEFVPADYEDRIIALEEKSADLMFISPEGNDNNDGLTANTPKKTVKACVTAGAKRISAKRGVYNEAIYFTTVKELEIFPTDNNKEYAVGISREPIVFEMVDYITPSNLTNYNSIKRVAYSGNALFADAFVEGKDLIIYNNGEEYGSRYKVTVWLLSEDEKTVCIKLKPVHTVAECEAEINRFAYVDGYIYINADLTNVAKIVVPTNGGCGIYIKDADRFVLKEVEVRFASSYNIDIRDCAYFDFYKCACKYTSFGSGFHPYNSNGIMTACYATKNYDGYGISGYGHTTYVDCVSEFNFDDGMSHHNGTSGTVIGGRYEGNGKAGNAPAYGAKVNIYGGIYKNNGRWGIGYLHDSATGTAEGTIDGAIIVGNPTGLLVHANCNVTSTNCIFEGNTTDKDIRGNLTEYNSSYVADDNESEDDNANEGESTPTNVLFTAINADGTPYVGDNGEKGYKVNCRINFSRVEIPDTPDRCCTGFIPVKYNDTVRIKNIYKPVDNEGNGYIHFYGADFTTNTGMAYEYSADTGIYIFTGEEIEFKPCEVKKWCNSNTNATEATAYMRISTGIIDESSIITINEEIVENPGGGSSENDNTDTPPLTEAEKLNLIKNWKYPIHEDAPVFLLDANKDAIPVEDKEHQDNPMLWVHDVYGMYDALVSDYSHYVTREEYTVNGESVKASDGTTPLYVYHFKEPTPHYISSNTNFWDDTKPVILICSGVHPTELAGVYSLYHAMEEITTNPKLLDLRRNVHFVVMPMINPTGFADSTWGVRNPDGIQVHYNFEVDFKKPTDSGYIANGNRNHGGETALSIPETKFFNALMEEYKDNLAIVVSCHNNDVDEQYGTGFIWCSCATLYMCNLGFRFIDKMSVAWKEKYGTAFTDGIVWANQYVRNAKKTDGTPKYTDTREQAEWDYRVGRAGISGSGGTEYKQALKYGVHGINVEVCDRCMILDKDFGKKRTANVVTMGTETYINFFRTFMAVYDPKNKALYGG